MSDDNHAKHSTLGPVPAVSARRGLTLRIDFATLLAKWQALQIRQAWLKARGVLLFPRRRSKK